MKEIDEQGNKAAPKDKNMYPILELVLEMYERGIKFLPIDLKESESTIFKVKDEKSMYPPFSSIDGLGDTVAKNIVEERNKKDFLSIEELQHRAKISSTLIEKMRMMGIFEGMEESNQLSLF